MEKLEENFSARYRQMLDSELLTLASDRANLVPHAASALEAELQTRRLTGSETAVSPNTEAACPLCDSFMDSGARLLYGAPVCGSCSSSFFRRRVLAHFIDEAYFFIVVPIILVMLFVQLHVRQPLVPVVMLVLLFYLLRDAYGLDIGKRLTGLEVIDTSTGKSTGFIGAFNRNLALLVPFAPIIMAFQIGAGPRLGDEWARTRVVVRKYRDRAPFAVEREASAASAG
jgi:uncharacterized RDD family membrane protein YckC